ncbi:MAG: prepilin-type N-terminal cleavage/methylation domain-containing protein [Proteobacteria bacterium]|nr:prepilin-type N-terminal cleavage/methylation domain-containing protein [Pseudomonadota bacterium]MCL2307479.1 prepilin-type N-terminal cleavage/methylation domain-containing protein [Pseudomonadota bacterium]
MKAGNGIRGFTLIELMVMVALLALFLALATPSIGTYLENTKIRNPGDELAGAMKEAQTHALKANRPTEFVLTLGAGGAVVGWTINEINLTATPPETEIKRATWQGSPNIVRTPGQATRITFNEAGRVMAANLIAPGIPPLERLDLSRAVAMDGVMPLRVEVNMLRRGIRVCAPHLATTDPKGCTPLGP